MPPPSPESPLRVAHVSFAFGEYTIRIASAMAPHATVGLWLTDRQAEPHLARLDPGVEFHPFHKPRLRQPWAQLPVLLRLVRDIRRFRPDVVHLQQGYLWFNPVLRFLRRFPLVVTIHDPVPHLGDRLGRKTPQFVADIAFREAVGAIVHNEQMRSEVVRRGLSAERVHIVPHVIIGDSDTATMVTDAASEENVVLFFGRIWPYKGLEYLIAAEPLIAEAVPDVRIVVAGTGENFSRYRRLMVHPERFDVINEFVPADRTAELFRRAAVVALPYVDATQSGVIPMAYNFARPVVATTVGGLPAMVDDGETGYLVPPRDVQQLAEAIIRLLEDPALRGRLGRQAKSKAEREYSAEAVAADTMSVYRTILGAGRGGRSP